MKLATCETNGRRLLGAVDRETIIDLETASGGNPAFASMQAMIEAGESALDEARSLMSVAGHRFALSSVRLRAPLPVPAQIRDASVFPRHIVNAPVGAQKLLARLHGRPEPDIKPGPVPQTYAERPVYYVTNRFSVIGPDDEVRWPRYSKVMDFELEFAVVIGKSGRDIPKDRAAEHIFGYTIFNDFSARDMQMIEMQGMLGPAKGKSFDMGNAFGPWIVTSDEIPDPKALRATARVNGETWVDSDTSEMLHGFDDMVAYISHDETLWPGEIIGSGTVGGGCGLEQGRYLEDGDIVELEFEKIGILRNRVVRQ